MKTKFLIVYNRWLRAIVSCWWLLVQPPFKYNQKLGFHKYLPQTSGPLPIISLICPESKSSKILVGTLLSLLQSQDKCYHMSCSNLPPRPGNFKVVCTYVHGVLIHTGSLSTAAVRWLRLIPYDAPSRMSSAIKCG